MMHHDEPARRETFQRQCQGMPVFIMVRGSSQKLEMAKISDFWLRGQSG